MKLKEYNSIREKYFGKEVKVTLFGNQEYIGTFYGKSHSFLTWVGNTAVYIKDIKNIELYHDNRIYKYVMVSYNDVYSSKDYAYKTTWKDIHVGDEVLVDCNGDNEEAEVTEIKYCRRYDAPWEPEKTKPIIHILDSDYYYNYADDEEDDGILVEERYDYNEIRYCPKCKDTKLIPIEYGYPSYQLLEKADRGEVYLGGCTVSPFDPCFYCKKCHLKYYEDLSDEKTINKLQEKVIEKLSLYAPKESDDMLHQFRKCPYIKQALENVLHYLNDETSSKEVNDLYVLIFRETHKKVIKHLINDDYEYFKDKDNNLIRLNLETGIYEIFAIELNNSELNKRWFTVEEYAPDMYDVVSNYDFNNLKKLEFQEDIDNYILKYEEDVKDEVKQMNEDPFGYFEDLDKDHFEYYIDAYNKSLHKKEKDANDYYEYVVRQDKEGLHPEWEKIEDWPIRDLRPIPNFKKVIDYHTKYIKELQEGIEDVDIDIDDITKED